MALFLAFRRGLWRGRKEGRKEIRKEGKFEKKEGRVEGKERKKGRRKEGIGSPKIRATALSWPQRKTTGLRIIRVGTGVANPETEEMQRTDLRKSRSSLDPRDKMKNIPSILRSRREMHS